MQAPTGGYLLWSADPCCSLWPACTSRLDVGQNRGQHGRDALRHHFLMLPLRHGCSTGSRCPQGTATDTLRQRRRLRSCPGYMSLLMPAGPASRAAQHPRMPDHRQNQTDVGAPSLARVASRQRCPWPECISAAQGSDRDYGEKVTDSSLDCSTVDDWPCQCTAGRMCISHVESRSVHRLQVDGTSSASCIRASRHILSQLQPPEQQVSTITFADRGPLSA